MNGRCGQCHYGSGDRGSAGQITAVTLRHPASRWVRMCAMRVRQLTAAACVIALSGAAHATAVAAGPRATARAAAVATGPSATRPTAAATAATPRFAVGEIVVGYTDRSRLTRIPGRGLVPR